MKPALILVGADKGGVGKTTVCRLLLDYLAQHGVTARAFDTESPRGTLERFHPDITEIVNINDTADQMRIIDTLGEDEAKVTLVDVRAGQLGSILAALDEFGFLEAAKEGEYNFLLFHILGSSIASLEEISETAPYATDAHYYLVKNFTSDGTYFEWEPDTYASYFDQVKSATDVTIPKLNELAYEQVDLAGIPLSEFIEDKSNSFVLRGYVRSWVQHVADEFDDVGILKALTGRGKAARRSPA